MYTRVEKAGAACDTRVAAADASTATDSSTTHLQRGERR